MDAGVHLLILLLAGPTNSSKDFTSQLKHLPIDPANNDQSLCYAGPGPALLPALEEATSEDNHPSYSVYSHSQQ